MRDSDTIQLRPTKEIGPRRDIYYEVLLSSSIESTAMATITSSGISVRPAFILLIIFPHARLFTYKLAQTKTKSQESTRGVVYSAIPLDYPLPYSLIRPCS